MSDALDSLIGALERDGSLREPGRLRERGDVLDRLESLLACELPDAINGATCAYRGRIETLRDELEAADRQLYRALRQAIVRGEGATPLLECAAAPDGDDNAGGHGAGDSYDFRDTLISGVLQLDEPAAPTADLEPEMVFYQPTPARHIFEMIERTALDAHDVLVDLGAGLGHVSLLAAICSGARCIGVEREATYVACARRCAQALKLDRVTFLQQDARETDLSAGTVFYLYTPFTGSLLREVLDRLQQEAARRTIRLCTLGPCTATVAREPWLQAIGGQAPDRPALFHSR